MEKNKNVFLIKSAEDFLYGMDEKVNTYIIDLPEGFSIRKLFDEEPEDELGAEISAENITL